MPSPVSNDDRAFLSRLNRLEKPTVQALCDEVGVTATAIRHRLTRLEELGVIERVRLETNGRGRPAYGYRLTESGRGSLGDSSAVLAQTLWREVAKIEDEEIRNSLLNRLHESLAEQYGGEVAGETPADRLRALSIRLRDLGLDVEIQQNGDGMLPILQEHCCPYSDVARGDARICELEERVFSAMVGAPVRLKSRCHEGGGSCCEFEIVDDANASGESVVGSDSLFKRVKGETV